MRFFMVYSNQYAVGNKPIGIASLAAITKKAGHYFQLFDCTAYSITSDRVIDWNIAGQENLEYMIPSNPERLPARQPVTLQELVAKLIAAIDLFKPDVIGLSALTDDYPLGLFLMGEIKAAFPNIPTIAGGVHATVDPKGVIAQPCFDMVCVGEGEYVMLDLGERVDNKQSFDGIANLWIKREDGSIEKNAVRPYEQNLDLLPSPDWTVFTETAFYKPFRGYVYKYGDFEMSRGCPYKCSYCINVQLQEIYKFTNASYHREKSISRVIAEIKEAIENYGIEFIKFWDETFLLMSPERMEEFCDRYSTEIGLPYVIETTAQSITPRSAAILRQTNCRSVSLGMETGSVDLRKGILHKPTSNDVYVNAFKLLEENGIQKVSFNMLGLPNESQDDIFRTIAMNRLVATDTQACGVFYPYKGTPIRDMMVEQGWMGEDFDYASMGKNRYDYNTFTSGNRTVVKLKDMDAALLTKIWTLFPMYCAVPARLFPLIDYVKNSNNDDFAAELYKNLQTITYHRKFGSWPHDVQVRDLEALDFGLETAEEFAGMLVRHWQGDNIDRVIAMLRDIAAGQLVAEFPIPEEKETLNNWLAGQLNEDQLRQTRAELRTIAKNNISDYAIDS